MLSVYVPNKVTLPRPISPRVIGAAIFVLAALLIILSSAPAVWAQKKPLAVPLQEIETTVFADFPPRISPGFKPAFKEKNFSLSEAVNWNEINALVGPLTETQQNYLAEKRFLLLPKSQFMLARPDKAFPADEMLGNFDGLGGSLKEEGRRPENARLIGPDIILHAFHRYIATRQEALEAGPLRENAHLLLSFLIENAGQLKKGALKSGGDWERLTAQLTVPLVILENCAGADEEDSADQDSLDNALAVFERYRAGFSPSMVQNIRGELRRVYRASSREISLLGLRPLEGGPEVSYRLFKPEGRSARLSTSRAYFRAMVWLKELGWDSRSAQGVTDAINFALAMSYAKAGPAAAGPGNAPVMAGNGEGGSVSKNDDSKSPAAVKPADVRSAWVRQVEIESFFQGAPSGYSYQQWLPFLMKEAGVPEFTADSGADPEVVGRLKSAEMPALAYGPGQSGPEIITVLPKAGKLTRALSEYLSHGKGDREKLPAMFSALWLPAMWGSKPALEMLPRQVALSVSGRRPDDDQPEGDNSGPAFLTARLEVMAKWLTGPEGDKISSLPLARLRLTGALFSEFGSGYPDYMRQKAFQVKRIESAAGVLVELAHETPSLSKALSSASPPEIKTASVEPPQEVPLVKGLVEPDLVFWAEMIRLVAGLEAGCRKYGLFPEDLEKLGSLSRFAKRLERCYDLAAKELSGKDLSADDYEFIRLFTLDWMALPPGDPGGRRPLGQLRSALVSDVRTVPGLTGQGVVIYEATGEPRLMLALVGNEKSPRVVVGLAFNHYEFAGPQGRKLTDEAWRKVAYGHYSQAPPPEGLRLPAKNFWYETLQP